MRFPIIRSTDFVIDYKLSKRIYLITSFEELNMEFKKSFPKNLSLENSNVMVFGDDLFGFIFNPLSTQKMIARAMIYLSSLLLDSDITFLKINNKPHFANSLIMRSFMIDILDFSNP